MPIFTRYSTISTGNALIPITGLSAGYHQSSIKWCAAENWTSARLPWLSVSSLGPIYSILLFSKVPIEELGGKTIAVSSDSETSSALLKIILREFFSLKCSFRVTKLHSVRNILADFPAVLHIGDTAMMEAK